jgi:hypothetical protein
MNLTKIFPDKKSRNEAIEHFISLKDNPDWIFLREKLINADIEDLSNKIFNPNYEWKEGEERESKRIRAYWIILSHLPEELIKSLMEKKPDIFENYDPYFKNIKELNKKR